MDDAEYNGVPIVVLESLRIRLSQLVHSLTNLSGRVHATDLGSWPALQQQFNVVLLQLSSLASTLHSFESVLQRCVAYPMPSFPVQTSEFLLTTLLRKKTLPEVDERIEKGIETGKEIDPARDDDFCEWALELAHDVGQISVKREEFASRPSATGWGADKVISFMSGKIST